MDQILVGAELAGVFPTLEERLHVSNFYGSDLQLPLQLLWHQVKKPLMCN